MALDGVRGDAGPTLDATGLDGVQAIGGAEAGTTPDTGADGGAPPIGAPGVRPRSVDFGGLTLQDQLLARLNAREGGGGAGVDTAGAPQMLIASTSTAVRASGPTGGVADPHAAEFQGLVDAIDDPKVRKQVAEHLNKGDYQKAHGLLEEMDITGSARGDALTKQVDFLAHMQKAGIKASHPPTEAELKAYFATFKGRQNPQDALNAFNDYAKAFHVHEGHIAGRRDPGLAFGDIAYKGGAPTGWGAVTGERTVTDGRYRNDCQGFALMAATLLGEAGFSAKYVLAKGELDKTTNSIQAHVMLEVHSGPPAKATWIISNQDYEQSTKDALANLKPPLAGKVKLERSAKPPKQG